MHPYIEVSLDIIKSILQAKVTLGGIVLAAVLAYELGLKKYLQEKTNERLSKRYLERGLESSIEYVDGIVQRVRQRYAFYNANLNEWRTILGTEGTSFQMVQQLFGLTASEINDNLDLPKLDSTNDKLVACFIGCPDYLKIISHQVVTAYDYINISGRDNNRLYNLIKNHSLKSEEQWKIDKEYVMNNLVKMHFRIKANNIRLEKMDILSSILGDLVLMIDRGQVTVEELLKHSDSKPHFIVLKTRTKIASLLEKLTNLEKLIETEKDKIDKDPSKYFNTDFDEMIEGLNIQAGFGKTYINV